MRVYTVSFREIAVTAVQDLLEINAGTNNSLVPLSFQLFQRLDVGDAAEEILEIRVRTGQTTSGSGGGTPTIGQNPGDAAESFTAERNNTTQASAGTIETLDEDGWNVRQPYLRIYTEQEQRKFLLQGGGRMTYELPVAPADSLTCTACLTLGEFGG